MAKGKKGDKKEKKVEEIDIYALTEVDKALYELTIADLKKKLERLESTTQELQIEQEELKQNIVKLDDEPNDTIVYYDKALNDKAEEIKDVACRTIELKEQRANEKQEFKKTVIVMQEEYANMREELTSDVKLLAGKLNIVEEYRQQKDELMKTYESKQNTIEDNELRHKKELYAIEKKFIKDKDQLRKDMEAKLMSLSLEFQKVTEVRINSTTHRAVRENIAMNNELNDMLETQQRLYDDNNILKDKTRTLKQEAEFHEDKKKKTLAKASVQYKVIEQLRKEHEIVSNKLEKYKDIENEALEAWKEMNQNHEVNEKLQHRVRILEQNLHANKCDRTSLSTELDYCKDALDRESLILHESVMLINAALKAGKQIKNKALLAKNREQLFEELLTLMSNAREEPPRKPSLETVQSIASAYDRGDMGFEPAPAPPRRTVPIRRFREVQIGPSFEEFLALYSPPSTPPLSVIVKSESTVSGSEQEETVKEVHSTKSVAAKGSLPKVEIVKNMFADSSEYEESEESSEDERARKTSLSEDEDEPEPPRVKSKDKQEVPEKGEKKLVDEPVTDEEQSTAEEASKIEPEEEGEAPTEQAEEEAVAEEIPAP